MNYFGQFRNLNNTLYQIDFQLDTGSGKTELVLSRDSFNVEYNGGDNIYEPIKLSNASCNIITTSIIDDLFSSKIHGVKVKLTDKTDDTVVWVGYVTPNLYSQGYDAYYNELEVELVDGLSTLENFEFTPTGEYVSFLSILIDGIRKTNCYKNIYINNNLFLQESNNYNNIMEHLYINDYNFYEDEKKKNYKEVLYSLLNYLNYTMTSQGEDVYILDYDYMNYYTSFTKYTTANNWTTYTPSSTNLTHTYSVTADSFMKNGAKLSLTDTKNRATIKVSPDIIDTVFPDVWEDDLLTNFTNEGGLPYYSRTYSGKTTIMRWLTNSKVKTFYYTIDTNGYFQDATLTSYNSNILKQQIYFGGTLTQLAEIDDPNDSSLSFTNYLVMKRGFSSNDLHKPILPMFELSGESKVALLYDNYYILINFKANFDTLFASYYPRTDTHKPSGGEVEVTTGIDGIYIEAQLKIGDKYWNGNVWQTTSTLFRIPLKKDPSNRLYNTWFSVENDVNFMDEIDGEGYKILINKSDNLIGAPTLTLYAPVFETQTYSIFIGSIWLSDFEAKLSKKADLLGFTKAENDVIYQNVINDDFSADFDTIELDVFSDLGKGITYQSVITKSNSGSYTYLGEIESISTTKKLQEYNKIEKLVNLYNAPNKKIDLTLKNEFKPYSKIVFLGENYIIDRYSIDYYLNSCDLTIIKIN